MRDDWQGHGLATLLMDEIESEARRRGLEQIVGYVLKDNENMHGMMVKRGYVRTTDEDDPNIDLFGKFKNLELVRITRGACIEAPK